MVTERDEGHEVPPSNPAFAAWLEQLWSEPEFLAWLDPAEDDGQDEEPPKAA